MAKKPTDDFDNIDDAERDWEEPIDDAADFGGDPHRRAESPAPVVAADEEEEHDDSDFVEDDMSDIVDDGDPRAADEAEDEDDAAYAAHDDDHDHAMESEEDFGEDEYLEEVEQEEAKKSKVAGLIFYGIILALVAGGGMLAYKSVFKNNAGTNTVAADISKAEESTTDKMKIVVPTNPEGPIPIPPTAPEADRAASSSGWQTNLSGDSNVPTEQPAAPTPAQQQQVAKVQAANAGVTAVPAPVDPQMLQSVSLLNGRISDMTNKLAQLTTEIGTLTANIGQISQVQQQQNSQIKALEDRPIPSANNAAVVRDPSTTNDIAELRRQLKAVQDRPVPTVAATTSNAAPAADVTALRTQISDLQKQLTQMKSAQDTTTKDLKASIEQQKRTVVAAAPVVAQAPALRKESPKVESKNSAKATASRPAPREVMEEVEQPRSPKTRAPAPSASTWVLRAATPGMAWVSPRPGSAELKRVVVGDQLASIGTIQSIRQEGGRWIVEGTNGTIR